MASPQIERRDIEPVPADERHGRPVDLLLLWFTPNVNVVGIVTGATAISLGLSLPMAFVAIVLGTAVGGLLMAFHSAQGPQLGLPQMIQSRAQFGAIGNLLPSLITVIDGVGYALLTYVVAAQALSHLLHISIVPAIVISAVICVVIAFVGYTWIHRYQKYLVMISIVLFVTWTVQAALLPAAPHAPVATGSGSAIMLAIAIFLASTLSWAPYVSDYSRYLPKNSGTARVVVYTFVGIFVSTVWAEGLGAFLATRAPKEFFSDSVGYMASLSPESIVWLLLIGIFLTQLAPTVLEIYTSFLTTMAAIFPYRKASAQTGTGLRAGVFIALVGIATIGAIAANAAGVIGSFSNFLTILAYLLMPWTAINLVDFYLIRKGRYSREEIFPNPGRRHAVSWGAVVIYLGAFALEFPFMNSGIFVGPIATFLGGADIAWIIGVVAAGAVYYAWARRFRRPAHAEHAAHAVAAPDDPVHRPMPR